MKKYIGLFIAVLLILLALPVYAQTIQVTLQQCSTAAHNSYKAQGPNGSMYPTWHPQIDFTNGCFHGHEHGSNPHLFYPNGALPKYRPVYGYTMPEESHNGFKTYVFDLDATHRAMVTQHFGTSNAVNAVCNRFHTFDLMLIDSTSGELLASTYMHGDFGKPVANEANITIKNICVDAAIGSNGNRQFPIVEFPYKNIGYEPWRLHRDHSIDTNPAANVYGFDSASITFNTINPRTACNTITCTESIQRIQTGFTIPALGTLRTIEFGNGSRFGFTGVISGTFTVHGLINYIKPGWNYRAGVIQRCHAVDTFNYPYICKNIGIDTTPFFKNVFITENN